MAEQLSYASATYGSITAHSCHLWIPKYINYLSESVRMKRPDDFFKIGYISKLFLLAAAIHSGTFMVIIKGAD